MERLISETITTPFTDHETMSFCLTTDKAVVTYTDSRDSQTPVSITMTYEAVFILAAQILTFVPEDEVGDLLQCAQELLRDAKQNRVQYTKNSNGEEGNDNAKR